MAAAVRAVAALGFRVAAALAGLVFLAAVWDSPVAVAVAGRAGVILAAAETMAGANA